MPVSAVLVKCSERVVFVLVENSVVAGKFVVVGVGVGLEVELVGILSELEVVVVCVVRAVRVVRVVFLVFSVTLGVAVPLLLVSQLLFRRVVFPVA